MQGAKGKGFNHQGFYIFKMICCFKQSQFFQLKFIILLSDSYCHLVHVQVQIISKKNAELIFCCQLNKQKLCDMDSYH